jgi:hypothetical protein
MPQYKPIMSGMRLKSGPGRAPRGGCIVARNRPLRGGNTEAIWLQTLTSAALIRLQANPACPRSWDRWIRPSIQRNRTFGTRMYGSRSRRVPAQAWTAACDSAGTSGSGAARWRKHALRRPVEIRASRIALDWLRCRRMTLPASDAVVKIAHFEKLISRGERIER